MKIPGTTLMHGELDTATAVMELLADEVWRAVEFFQSCSESWKKVSIENQSLSDRTRIDGCLKNGVISVRKRGGWKVYLLIFKGCDLFRLEEIDPALEEGHESGERGV